MAPLLFGFDLEDVLTMIPDGDRYERRVEINTLRVLDAVEELGMRCTCFTVGNVVARYPGLVRRIAERGHELACHTSEHRPLDRQDAASLREDLRRNRGVLEEEGATQVVGFRAPIASLTPETAWAYEVLAEEGFTYSSSVLAARHPLYGWPGFGLAPRRTESDVWEIPVSLTDLPILNLPYAGGVYLRVLPLALIRWLARREADRGRAVVSHLHPYDVDTEQERFMHPELGDSALYNALMYLNRRRALERVRRLVRDGFEILPFRRYVGEVLEAAPSAA